MDIFGDKGGKMLSHIAISLHPYENMYVRIFVFLIFSGLILFCLVNTLLYSS